MWPVHSRKGCEFSCWGCHGRMAPPWAHFGKNAHDIGGDCQDNAALNFRSVNGNRPIQCQWFSEPLHNFEKIHWCATPNGIIANVSRHKRHRQRCTPTTRNVHFCSWARTVVPCLEVCAACVCFARRGCDDASAFQIVCNALGIGTPEPRTMLSRTFSLFVGAIGLSMGLACSRQLCIVNKHVPQQEFMLLMLPQLQIARQEPTQTPTQNFDSINNVTSQWRSSAPTTCFCNHIARDCWRNRSRIFANQTDDVWAPRGFSNSLETQNSFVETFAPP